MKEAGTDPDSVGCEARKPVVASIFASLRNKYVMDRNMFYLAFRKTPTTDTWATSSATAP